VSAVIEEEDYRVLMLAGWCFSKQVRGYCHGSADIYRKMLGAPILEKIVAKDKTPTNTNEEDE
jgi:hypothetical protein